APGAPAPAHGPAAAPPVGVATADRRAEKARATPPPAPVPAPAADTAPAHAAPGSMDVEVQASGRTFVVLICDGKEVANRAMSEGEHERARCDSVVRISASDAGATRLTVNGADCLPLGEPGSRAYGYTIRI